MSPSSSVFPLVALDARLPRCPSSVVLKPARQPFCLASGSLAYEPQGGEGVDLHVLVLVGGVLPSVEGQRRNRPVADDASKISAGIGCSIAQLPTWWECHRPVDNSGLSFREYRAPSL